MYKKGMLCPACKGSGTIQMDKYACTKCEGIGKLPGRFGFLKPCPKCWGTGVRVTVRKCTRCNGNGRL